MRGKKNSLGVLALLIMALLAMLPVAVSTLYFTFTTSARLESNARSAVDFYIGQFVSRSEAILQAVRGGIYILATDPQLLSAMRAPEKDPSSAITNDETRGRMLSRLGWEQDCVTGIFVFTDRDRYASLLRTGVYSGAVRRAVAIFTEFENENSARDLFVSESCPGYCYMVVDYFDISVMRPLGKIIFEIDADKFIDNRFINEAYPGTQVFLSDLSGRILADPADAPQLQGAMGAPMQPSGFVSADEGDYYHSSNRLGVYKLRVDVFVPSGAIFGAVNDTTRIFAFFTAAVLAVTLIAGMGLYLHVARPLKKMINAINAVSGGDLNTRMPSTPYRETEMVVSAFNAMTERLRGLFHETYTKGLHLRQAEFMMLEAQINPHFIFNVLEAINMRVMAAGQDDVCRMISNLAELIRANISHKHKQKITFGQELEYVRYYLELQKYRFQEALQYEIQLEDDEILGLYLPKLAIQPIVENSVVHGLESKRGGGTVQVRIWEEESGVFVRVTDDGMGFDPSLLQLDTHTENADGHNRVALYNVNRRIQLLYGNEYGLSVKSQPGAGASVTLSLPADTGQEELEVEPWRSTL